MIRTILQISFRRLLHNRVELMLTFVVPIAFFSIFAVIFGGGLGSGATPKVKVVAVDEVASPQSQAIVESLRESGGLRFMRDEEPTEISRSEAEQMVRSGGITMAIVLSDRNGVVAASLLADSSDQVAGQVVSALVTQAIMLAKSKMAALPALPPNGVQQVDHIDQGLAVASEMDGERQATIPVSGAAENGVQPVEIIDVLGNGKSNPVVTMYAAGIAVMFLLFGASGGGGALLDERENKTLDRLLSTRMTMDQLLLGKWFYLTMIGILQVSVMFAWGQIVFGVDLLGNLDGFIMITVVTASAAAAFGLFLATLCRTRGQLNGLSIILILTMSALGGSMVPRYVMSERMRDAGMWTFNAWALDGYDKVFWRDLPVADLAPQLFVLMGCGILFLMLARLLAIRWECD